MPRVATRFDHIQKSATYAVLDLVRELRAQGADVLDLGGGEPDFDTPEHISDAAVSALREGFTHYTPSRGTPELLEAIAEKLAKDNDLLVDPMRDVVVTPSAKHALSSAVLTVAGPGDELIVPTPSWVSYAAMAHLAGARPVPAPLSARDGFRLTAGALEQALTRRTRAVLVNTPNNPTGRLLDADELTTLVRFAREHDLVIISDEIYEKITYADRPHLSPAALPGGAERTLTVNGFSKGYAMTGWRLGYVAGPTEIIAELLKVQQHTVGCASSFAQRGAVVALTGPQEPITAMTTEYAARRDLLVAGLNGLPGVTCAVPDGALYVFPDIRGTGRGDSARFTEWLLREAGVAVTPGSAFGEGGEGHVRLSFATSREVLADAVGRIGTALGADR
ncbi:pyridoxal phosphate-dependent aminotransferase [Lentzea sp. NPDC042327]|uniref:pyridoxal phosphate-dependent aminotransferase n=1 Tax=Lentzea sp. NPDC042327 TaxID=3154801 RepID=UPI0033EE403F